MSNKEAIVKAPSGRVRRTSVGARNVLTVSGKETGYHYHIVNDDGDRIQQFKDAGYDVVQANDVRVGDKRVNSASPEGSAATMSVSRDGRKAVVMRIKDEWYNEDQAAKLQGVNELEATTKHKALDGTYGKLEFTRD